MTNPPEPDPSVQALHQKLDETLQHARKRKNVVAIVMVVVVVAMVIYLSVAYSQIAKFDSEVVVNAAAHEFQQYMAQSEPVLAQRLTDEAPNVIQWAEGRVFEAPEALASQIEAMARQKVKALTPELEEELYETLKHAILEARDRVGKAEGEPVSSEEFGAILDDVALAFGEQVERFIDTVYGRFSPKIQEFTEYLEVLAKADQTTLDRRQQQHRDLLITFLALMEKWQKEKGGPEDGGTGILEALGGE